MTFLWTIQQPPPAEAPEFVIEAYNNIKPYLETFLTGPHPYRKGVMCPFMPKALLSNEIYFSCIEKRRSDQEIISLIENCITFYKARARKTPGAIIILFEPDLDTSRLLRIHIEAKPICIKSELMIGALYKDSPAPSLHSNSYFPLRTTIPTLVLRDLTSQDLLFLNPDHYNIKQKIGFLDSFINKFSPHDGKGFTGKQLAQAKALRNAYAKTRMKNTVALVILSASVALCTLLALGIN